MNKEPIAWWYGKYEDETDDFMYPETRENHIKIGSVTPAFYPIPLYTAPKDLSDEEIYEIWEQFNGEIKNFARALLKKASEK